MDQKSQGDNYSFSDLKNSAIAINSAGANQSISVSSDAGGAELDEVIARLTELTELIKAELPDDKKEHFGSDFETFVREVNSDAPREKWYRLSGEGLMEAALAVATFPAKVLKEYKDCIDLASLLAKAKLIG